MLHSAPLKLSNISSNHPPTVTVTIRNICHSLNQTWWKLSSICLHLLPTPSGCVCLDHLSSCSFSCCTFLLFPAAQLSPFLMETDRMRVQCQDLCLIFYFSSIYNWLLHIFFLSNRTCVGEPLEQCDPTSTSTLIGTSWRSRQRWRRKVLVLRDQNCSK